jgi:glycine C-acetyltransferase
MSIDRVNAVLKQAVEELGAKGTAKAQEMVVTAIRTATATRGPRYLVESYGDREFLRMNSNSYLGITMAPEVIEAEEAAANQFGTGPGAVRFISGTYQAHTELEAQLARFHAKEAGMLFSSAYVTSLGVLMPLATTETVYLSDELNHNCIIQAMRLSRPQGKAIYQHNDMGDLEAKLEEWAGQAKRALVVTDGIFSMRGDNVPLQEFVAICAKYEDKFEEGLLTIMDDSHGVGCFGRTGRGTEEYCGAQVDVLIGTLGKAFGVNGGYVVTSQPIVDYLRQTSPMYIYSNPITVAEAKAASAALQLVDSARGLRILGHLRAMTKRFQEGLARLGYETIPGDHPVVPLMVRDTAKTAELVRFLTERGVLVTGLNFPVVPKGDEEIRFQVNGDLRPADIDYVLEVLSDYQKG